MQLVLSWLQSRPLRLQPDAAATPATPAKCAVSLTPLLSLENLVFPLMISAGSSFGSISISSEMYGTTHVLGSAVVLLMVILPESIVAKKPGSF